MNYTLYNDTLCPDVWEKNGSGWEMKSDIREHLLKIASDFVSTNIKENDISLSIKDIILIGSLANYNWTKASDFDTHILVDFTELDMKPEMAKILVDGLKSAWNNSHSITIKGHPVELYIQDIQEQAQSSAIFSVKRDVWIKPPEKKKPEFDKTLIQRKHLQLKQRIDNLLKNPTAETLEAVLDRLYEMRQAGLDKKGEFSEENIVFKILRSQGYMELIKNAIDRVYDNESTLDEGLIDDGIALGDKGQLELPSDEDDPTIPTDNDSTKRVHKTKINGIPIRVFAAYELRVDTAREMKPIWAADGENFSHYVTNIRHAVKHPKGSGDKTIVDELIELSIPRLKKQIGISDVEIILPLGSSSGLNLQIAERIKKEAPNAHIATGMISKTTWKDVTLSAVWAHELKQNPESKGCKYAKATLAHKQRLSPNQTFEVKQVPRGQRRYFSSFYRAENGEILTGKKILIIDDTLEEGATLTESIRTLQKTMPREISAYIFLYGKGT